MLSSIIGVYLVVEYMEPYIPYIVILLAVFTQSLTGFGSALVAMAFLPELIGIQVAAPLVALVAVTIEIILLIRYRRSLNLSALWRLVLASIVGIPLGIWALKGVSEEILLPVLGTVITGYSLYALFNFRMPKLGHPTWAYIAGWLSGLLSGAYNTGGPPIVIYGNCRGWEPEEFKSNLQGFFIISDLLVVLGHSVSHNITASVLNYYVLALPVVALGILAGTSLARIINSKIFSKIILALLVVMGIRLMV
jgi:uncharacterized membrane protein YfcA